MSSVSTSAGSGQVPIGAYLARAEGFALGLSESAVSAFDSRCAKTKSECEGLHFSACQSRLIYAECATTGVTSGECSDRGCGLVQDFTYPVVQIPASLLDDDNYLNDLDAVETICYSISLDPEFARVYDASQSANGIFSPFTYFGSWTGVMRIYPGAAYSEDCGEYDPRVRPWYVASSSGPKDVIILMDISSSMQQQGRLELAKDAVESVLDTMNANTFVNIVLFSSTATALTTENLLRMASDEHKKELVDLLSLVSSTGATNYEAALTKAFDVLEASRAVGETASSFCATAILLLSDGVVTDGSDASELVTLVQTLNVDIQAQLFTFALGPDADTDTLKTLACGTAGIYQAIPDGGSLSTAMAFYYRYYAIGLGSNANYTAYSSLYNFSANYGGGLGFSIASPAYDLTSDPPAFLGVASVDFYVQSFLDLGFTMAELEDQVSLGGKDCPAFNLTDCQLQQFRGSISTESVCDDGCATSDAGSLEPERCMDDNEYPTSVWNNVDSAGLTLLERTCCDGGTFNASSDTWSCNVGDSSDEPVLSIFAVAGLAAAGFVVLVVCLGACCSRWKRRNKANQSSYNFPVSAIPTS